MIRDKNVTFTIEIQHLTQNKEMQHTIIGIYTANLHAFNVFHSSPCAKFPLIFKFTTVKVYIQTLDIFLHRTVDDALFSNGQF
jgi:hypothetical protein